MALKARGVLWVVNDWVLPFLPPSSFLWGDLNLRAAFHSIPGSALFLL